MLNVYPFNAVIIDNTKKKKSKNYCNLGTCQDILSLN